MFSNTKIIPRYNFCTEISKSMFINFKFYFHKNNIPNTKINIFNKHHQLKMVQFLCHEIILV